MSRESIKEKKFLFIGGLHRSGTTVLGKTLGTHSKISNLYAGNDNSEGQFYQKVYPKDKVHRGVGRFAFRPEANLTEKCALATEDNAIALFESWSQYWDLNKDFLLEKTPRNLVMSRFLQSLYPNSYFLFITRHPVAVTLASQKWSKTSLTSLINHWIRAHTILEDDRGFLKNSLTIRYEDFVGDTQATLNQISAFLHLENEIAPPSLVAGINDKYFHQWEKIRKSNTTFNRKIIKGFVKLTNNKFPVFVDYDRELEDIEYRFEEQIQRFGYSFYQQ